MANDWDTVTNNADREKMVTIARITKKITIRSILLANIVVAAFLPARLSSMIYNDKELFYRGYYPYNTTISPNFELTLIGQLMAALYTAITYTTVDTFVVLLIFHVCGQLSILRDDLRKIHSYDDKNVEMKLQKIVQRHVYINRFVSEKNRSFIDDGKKNRRSAVRSMNYNKKSHEILSNEIEIREFKILLSPSFTFFALTYKCIMLPSDNY